MTRFHLSRRRLAWLLSGAAAFVLLVGLAWLAVTALLARSEVSKAKNALSQLRDSIVAADTAKATAEAAAVADHANQAHALTTGPAWWIASQLPWIGEPLETVRGASAQADLLGRDALPTLVKVADELSPSTMRDGDTVHIGRLAAAAAELHHAAVATGAAARSIAGLPHKTWLGGGSITGQPAARGRRHLRHGRRRRPHSPDPARNAGSGRPQEVLRRTAEQRRVARSRWPARGVRDRGRGPRQDLLHRVRRRPGPGRGASEH